MQLRSLFILCLTLLASATSLFAQKQILQVRYAGVDPATGGYVVRVRSNPASAESREDDTGELVAIEFTAASDKAVLAAFEKVSRLWLFRPAPADAGIACEVVLRLSLVCDQSPPGSGGAARWAAALRDWHLEMPVVVRTENMGDENYFAGRFLVESADLLLGGTLTPAEWARHVRTEPKRVEEFDKEARSAMCTGMVLFERVTAERLAALGALADGRSTVRESKLRRQVAELRVALAKLESAAGGCVVEGEGNFGLSATVPSLVAAGGSPSDQVALFLFVRAMGPEEGNRLAAEFDTLAKEWAALKPRYAALLDVREGKRLPSAEEKVVIARCRELFERMRTIGDIPMARYKDIGLRIGGGLASVGSPTSKASLQAMKAFYRTAAQVVEFYDLPALEAEMDEYIARAKQ